MAKYVTIKEAAEALDCTVGNIYHKIKRYGIPTETRTIEHREVVVRNLPTRYIDLDELKSAGRKG